jgi:spore coat protein A
VEPRRYRFRFLDGSNARFLNMWLETDVKNPKPGPEFQVIGSDGGFLDRPSLQQELLMGPGERYDVIIDFSAYAGKDLILRNDGNMPSLMDPPWILPWLADHAVSCGGEA